MPNLLRRSSQTALDIIIDINEQANCAGMSQLRIRVDVNGSDGRLEKSRHFMIDETITLRSSPANFNCSVFLLDGDEIIDMLPPFVCDGNFDTSTGMLHNYFTHANVCIAYVCVCAGGLSAAAIFGIILAVTVAGVLIFIGMSYTACA